MLFTSLAFFIFLAITLVLFYVLPKKCQWIVLLVASFVFYISFSWKFLFFIIASIATIYGATYGIDKVNKYQAEYLETHELSIDEKKAFKAENKKKRKTYLILCILFNIGILFVLKYANFFASNFVGLINLFGAKLGKVEFSLILPLGISFYTFQAVGYLVDVYWGKVQAEKNIFRLALFVSFFPQIVQGPISKYSELGPQLKEEKKFDYNNILRGVLLILYGLFKKLMIADVLSSIVSTGFDKAVSLNGLQTWTTVIAYLIQDYMDFSGCIDIVIGVGECFGMKLPQNFNRPYFSLTIEEYWRRWHMTLGTWFKEYIFYPISISKFSMKFGKFCKKHSKPNSFVAKQMPAIFGLLVVWLTTGLWHGASWNYICWGLYYGLIIVLSILLKPLFTKIIAKLKINVKSFWYKGFQWMRTIWLLCVGRIIFRSNSMADAWALFTKTFSFIFTDGIHSLDMLITNYTLLIPAAIAFALVLTVDIIKEFKKDISIREWIIQKGTVLQTVVIAMLMVSLVLFGAYGPGFSAQDFIYMQF